MVVPVLPVLRKQREKASSTLYSFFNNDTGISHIWTTHELVLLHKIEPRMERLNLRIKTSCSLDWKQTDWRFTSRASSTVGTFWLWNLCGNWNPASSFLICYNRLGSQSLNISANKRNCHTNLIFVEVTNFCSSITRHSLQIPACATWKSISQVIKFQKIIKLKITLKKNHY